MEVQAVPGATQGRCRPVRAVPSPAREEVGGLPVVLLPETGVGEAGAPRVDEAATETIHAAARVESAGVAAFAEPEVGPPEPVRAVTAPLVPSEA